LVFITFIFSAGNIYPQRMDFLNKIRPPDPGFIPQSLLNKKTVNPDSPTIELARDSISQEGNYYLNYHRSLIPFDNKISVNPTNQKSLDTLLLVLKDTDARVMTISDGQMAVNPLDNSQEHDGIVAGRVVDKATQDPLIGTNIEVVGKGLGGTTDNDGNFYISQLPEGEYTLEFSYIGYESKKIELIKISANTKVNLNVELTPIALQLKEIIVTPGQFSIMGKEPVVRQSLTRQELENITFGEDIYRAINRLPGISSSDFSSRFTVRGGDNNEVLVLMDGMELLEPFHLKEIDGGALSIIDPDIIEGVDLFTGGFPAEYGDRTSGVFNIKSTNPYPGENRSTLGISFMNARIMSEGVFKGDRGSYQFSARRGYLDLVLDLMDEEDPPRPTYYDISGKLKYNLSKIHTLAVNLLLSRDRLDYVEDDDDEDNTSYGNMYCWVTLKSMIDPRLYVQSLVSLGRITHDRQGKAYVGDENTIDFIVSDKNNVNLYGIKQDWDLEISDRWYVKWGYEYKYQKADYDYFNCQLNRIWVDPGHYVDNYDTTTVALTPEGGKTAVYLSNRFRLYSPLTLEIGLRYDKNAFTSDTHLSPRLNLVYSLGKQTFMRGGWGYFYQSQGIHELQVEEGEYQFYPAELAKHWVAGFEHTFGNGFNFRLEGYYKQMSDIHPDYRNWSNSIEIFPEVQDDRYKLNFNSKDSKGLEFYMKYDQGKKFSWWASYAFAYVNEDIESLLYQGIEYRQKDSVHPGKYDQRHTVYLDMNYRPSRNWHLYLSWQYHTGWPYTPLVMKSAQAPDGSTYYYASYENYYGARYPAYQRVDFRINRHFYLNSGRISLFFALINVFNHLNVRNIIYETVWIPPSGPAYLVEEKEYWFKLMPSVGISWSWDH